MELNAMFSDQTLIIKLSVSPKLTYKIDAIPIGSLKIKLKT